jgi:hypothetical protein
VPTSTLTLTTVTATPPSYSNGAHATVVADVHELLLHEFAPVSEAIADGSAVPKFKPLIVTVPIAEDALFLGTSPLVTGAVATKFACAPRVPCQTNAWGDVPSNVKPRLAVFAPTWTHTSRLAPDRSGCAARGVRCPGPRLGA